MRFTPIYEHARSTTRAVASPKRIVTGITALALSLTAAILPRSAGAQTATTFTPVADSYVDAATPTTNYGTRTTLRTDASPVVRSYLRFDVQGVTNAASSTLKIFANSSNGSGIEARAVADNTWGERTVTYNNAPPVGPVLDSSGAVTAGRWYELDVSAAVVGPGAVSFAITSPSSTATSLASRESTNRPQLEVSAEPAPTPSTPTFVVSRQLDTYQAANATTGTLYSGTLKFVLESAARDLNQSGGGRVIFLAGVFDFGSEYGLFHRLSNIEFAGQGMDATIIQNFSTAIADTEPFNMHTTSRVTIRDLTVSAGGSVRPSSDAIDFDEGNDTVIERVKVSASRGRGIVFDGKGLGWTADRNILRGCVITGVPGDGIELLAASQNRIEGCTVSNVGGYGIQITKASSQAEVPHKKANDNVLFGNVIDESGTDGINISSSDRNVIDGNTVTNSSDDVTSRDGIRITSFDGITSDDNVVRNNRATDTQLTKTQTYGLHIASALCNRTVVGPNNDFSGNRVSTIRDRGTGTRHV
jgi:parallel beta-helix repeat protein